MKKKKIFTLLLIIGWSFFFNFLSITISTNGTTRIKTSNLDIKYINIEWDDTWDPTPPPIPPMETQRVYPQSIVLDKNNNVIITGGLYNLSGYREAFLIKYDNSGEYKWYESLGDYDETWANSVDIDSSGNIYITGVVQDYIPNNISLFLSKYSPSGSHQWDRFWSPNEDSEGSDIYIDSQDRIYVIGTNNSPISGTDDICLLAYNSSGHQIFVKEWDLSGPDEGLSIDGDDDNSLYLGGFIGFRMMGLIKTNMMGEIQWNVTTNTLASDYSVNVRYSKIENRDNIYLIGEERYYSDSLFKFDSEGNFEILYNESASTSLWPPGVTSPIEMALDSKDNFYLAGGYYNESWNFYIQKISNSGKSLWGIKWKISNFSASEEVITALTLDTNNSIYIAGAMDGILYIAKFNEKPISSDTSIPINLDFFIIFLLIGTFIGILSVIHNKFKVTCTR